MRMRSLWYAAAVLAGLAVATPVTLRQLSRERERPAVKTDKADPQRDSVRVEHELVTIEAVVPAPVASPIATTGRVSPRVSPAPPPRTVVRAAAPAPVTLGQKARRAFLGDGRHRPQPFPTVR